MKFKSLTASILGAVVAMGLSPDGLQAQDNRKDFIENIFKSIMEARSERHRQGPGSGYGQGKGHGRPTVPPASRPIPEEVKSYRGKIASYAKETDELAEVFAKSAVRSPNLRPYLPEIYGIRSQAAVLNQNAANMYDLQSADAEFRAIDVAWRDLSYKLKNVRGLDSNCRECIGHLDTYSNDLCGVFGIQAEFDRIQAVVLAAQASAYVDSLLDVLQYELYDQPNYDELINDCRQQIELARQFASSLNDFSMAEATETFGEWSAAWRKYGAKLHSFHNPRLARAAGRVRRCQKDLYDLFRVERPMDYSYIDYLSAQCGSAADDLFGNLSVRTLSGLKRDELEYVFEAERTLRPQFDGFCKRVTGSPNYDQVVRDYVALENNWMACSSYLSAISQGEVGTHRLTIDNYMTEMRNLLQIAERLDMERTLSLAASVEGMANSLYSGLISRMRYIPSRSARSRCLIYSQNFVKSAKAFHGQVSGGAGYDDLQKSCGVLVDSWQKCSNEIQALPKSGMRSNYYESISRVRSQIDPSMAELAVVLAP